MRLDFNILWVEDQVQAVNSQRERIDFLLKKEGFRLRTEFASSVHDAMAKLDEDVYSDHVDMVLMDYDLRGGPNGDQGLVEVRRLMPFKDIVFYSARGGDLKRIVREVDVEGVHLTTRHDLPDIVQGVFLNLVKKVLDIDHSRGIVMGATCDIDYLINKMLKGLFDSADEDQKQQVLADVQKRLEAINTRFAKGVGGVQKVTNMDELFALHFIYTSADRLKLLKSLIERLGVFSDHNFMQTYLDNIVPKRNDIAHVRVEAQGFVRKLFDRNDVEITGDEMKTLRIDLLNHQEEFEAFLAIVEGSGRYS